MFVTPPFRPARPMRWLLPLIVATTALAQAPLPPADSSGTASMGAGNELDQLIRRLEAAHHPAGPAQPITSFRCDLELRVLDPKVEHRAPIDLAVQFLLWQREGDSKVRPLIRYEIPGGEQPIVRGRDELGYWHLFRGEPRDLTGGEFAQDLAACKQHTNLARQLLRFLSPGDVLRAMQRTSKVTHMQLRIERQEVACSAVAGDLPAFPLLQNAGDDAPVRLQIYVDDGSGRLLGVDVWPTIDGTTDLQRGERIMLHDLEVNGDLLVPRRLDYLFRDESGRLQLNSRALLTTLDLRPGLTVGDFSRSR